MRCPICNDCISQWERHKCEEDMPDNQESSSKELDDKCICQNDNPDHTPHTRECMFGHFLSYTQYHKYNSEIIEALRKAYYDGIEVSDPKQFTTTQQALDTAVKALKFYADEKNYYGHPLNPDLNPYDHIVTNVEMDEGNVAQAALASIKE